MCMCKGNLIDVYCNSTKIKCVLEFINLQDILMLAYGICFLCAAGFCMYGISASAYSFWTYRWNESLPAKIVISHFFVTNLRLKICFSFTFRYLTIFRKKRHLQKLTQNDYLNASYSGSPGA